MSVSNIQKGANILNRGARSGSTDIRTIIGHLTEGTGWNSKMQLLRVNWESGGAQGYFGTSSVIILANMSSVNYGMGIMLSDSTKSVATFIVTNGTAHVYKWGLTEVS